MSGISSISDVNALERFSPVRSADTSPVRKEDEKKEEQVGAIAARPDPAEDNAHPDPDSVAVARSSDGDTARASRTALENLSEGMVFRKAEKNEAVQSEAAQKGTARNEAAVNEAGQAGDDKKAERPITSMTGYTDSQVDQLYRQGRISRQDYDKEMDRREQIDEAAGLKEDTNPVVDTAREASAKEVVEKQTEEIQSEKTQENKKTESDAESATEEKVAERKKQIITEEMENDKEFIDTMGQMVAKEQDFSLRADAVMDSIAAGRGELMQQVMDAASRVAATEPTQ